MSSTFTVENLLHILLPVAPKWKELGERLFLTNDTLDDIYTNNRTHSACLEKMLSFYMMKTDHDLQQDRKGIMSNALLKMGEKILAAKIDQLDSEDLSTQSHSLSCGSSPSPELLDSVEEHQVTSSAIPVYSKLQTEGTN